eukprot:3022371-Rhodomonas_salina.2
MSAEHSSGSDGVIFCRWTWNAKVDRSETLDAGGCGVAFSTNSMSWASWPHFQHFCWHSSFRDTLDFS